jgi:hypothetical protein
MMAKMFYTLDEAKNVLGRSEDEIKAYARDGKLREFRDGPRLMFKADQVEQLRSELSAGGDHVDLGVSDSGGMIDLVDTTAASGTSVTLSDTTGGQSTSAFGSRGGTGVGSGIGTGIGSGMKTKDDTALAADLGLSGTATGIPSPARHMGPSGTGLTGLSGTASGSRAGINVFGTDDLPDVADPSAQTSISPAAQEINLESVGSGSGLLDLSRERDDTSLGAVLEEISPAAMRADDVGLGGGVELEEPHGGIDRGPVMPVYVQAVDPWAPAFGAAAFAAAGAAIFGIFTLICGVLGTWPDSLKWFDTYKTNQPWLVVGMGLAAAVIFFVIGALIGKASSGRVAR